MAGKASVPCSAVVTGYSQLYFNRGNIITKSRNKLSSTTIKELIVLKSWKTSIKRLEEIYKENKYEK